MDAFEVVYPQYWLQPKHEMRFVIILTILKVAICRPKKVGFRIVFDHFPWLENVFVYPYHEGKC